MKKVGVLGATGYVGEELVRLLYNHPEIELVQLASHSYVGQEYSAIYPQYKQLIDMTCVKEDVQKMELDILFIALPHGLASKVITKDLLQRTKVIDVGADFRISLEAYNKWYKVEHYGKDILEDAVYGLSEWQRGSIKEARLIANPGCYVTCSLLTLLPLIKEKVIDQNAIIIDAKSGVTGAGRSLNLGTHFTECNESIKAYHLFKHRHTPEIKEKLQTIGGVKSNLIFTPHLIPMNRGILTTIYTDLKASLTEKDVLEVYNAYYGKEKFIRVLGSSAIAETRWVKGSNYCDISFEVEEGSGKLICVSAIDNMMKGAAGQAVQNMNIMMGWKEDLGIDMPPLFPC